MPSQNKTEFSLDSLNYPDLPTLPEPARPEPQTNGTTNGHGPPPATPNPHASPTPTGNIPPRKHATQAQQISQNVPAATKPINPATPINSVSMLQPQNKENHVPNVPVTQQFSNAKTQQQPLPSQGMARMPHQPSPNTTPNANVSKVISNDKNVHQAPILPQQSGHIHVPVASNQDLKPANQVTSGQAVPNKPNAPQSNTQAPHTGKQSQITASLPNSHSQAGASLPNNATSHPKVPSVAPQSSTGTMTNANSPVGGPSMPPIQQSHIPSPIPLPQQTPQHPSGVSPPHSAHAVNGQLNPTPHPQSLASTISPTHPQASMAQQLRPNVSGILPKMPTRNPSSQPNIPRNTAPAPQSVPTSTAVPQPNTTRVPQTSAQRPTLPNVPQLFTSSRTGMTHGLPPGWERVLDKKTGRYYFRDHNTKTTHWNPPESLTQTINRSIMGHNVPSAKEVEPKKPSLKRSLSSPNLAKIADEEIKPKVQIPNTPSRPSVNRRTKPLSESQLANLSPSHGGQGKALTGLRNLGNSCYMNSVLQCLLATAPLAKYIVNSFYLDDINKTNPLGTGGRIAEELAVLTRVAHSGNYKSVSPCEFKRTIGRFAPEFGGTKQQDSQEFLLVLLDQFHEDTNRVSGFII